jgi:hypothetical protein
VSRTKKDTKEFKKKFNVLESPPLSWKRNRKKSEKAKVKMALKYGTEPPHSKNNFSDWW